MGRAHRQHGRHDQAPGGSGDVPHQRARRAVFGPLGAKSKQKNAQQGISEAEKGQKSGAKALVKAKEASEEAEDDAENAREVYKSFEFLFNRSSAAQEGAAEEAQATAA